MLFMGEEYSEPAPFLYCVSHSDPDLVTAVSAGRKEEFRAFKDQGEPPVPHQENTFLRSKLNQALVSEGHHRVMHSFYAELIYLRTAHNAFRPTAAGSWTVQCHSRERVVEWTLVGEDPCRVRVLLNFGQQGFRYSLEDKSRTLLDSASPRWAPEPRHDSTDA